MDPKLPDSQYKLGWDVNERNGYKVVSHGGGMTGTRTSLLLLPSENIAVVVLCNGEYMDLSRIYDSILAVMLPSYRKNQNTKHEIKSSGESNKLHSLSQCEGEWAGKIITYKGNLPVQLYRHLHTGELDSGKCCHARLRIPTSTRLCCRPCRKTHR